MAIKVLIKRDFKAGNLKQVSQLLNRARYGAMGMKGYISSETLTDLKNPNRVVFDEASFLRLFSGFVGHHQPDLKPLGTVALDWLPLPWRLIGSTIG